VRSGRKNKIGRQLKPGEKDRTMSRQVRAGKKERPGEKFRAWSSTINRTEGSMRKKTRLD
jgi:hypothetical protein